MIEDKELGLKIAENPEEKFWLDVKDRCNKAIEGNNHEIVINEHILKLCDEMLKPFNNETSKQKA